MVVETKESEFGELAMKELWQHRSDRQKSSTARTTMEIITQRLPPKTRPVT